MGELLFICAIQLVIRFTLLHFQRFISLDFSGKFPDGSILSEIKLWWASDQISNCNFMTVFSISRYSVGFTPLPTPIFYTPRSNLVLVTAPLSHGPRVLSVAMPIFRGWGSVPHVIPSPSGSALPS